MAGAAAGPPRRARIRLAGLLASYLAMVGGVVYYGVGLGQPIKPDHGLRQLDAMTLHERVAGVAAIGGQPTLFAAAGDVSVPRCADQLRAAAARHGTAAGFSSAYALVVLVPAMTVPADIRRLAGVRPRADPGGALATRLALPRAVRGCYPGYALVDGQGFVRYRTYDPQWGEHGQEQGILLGALR